VSDVDDPADDEHRPDDADNPLAEAQERANIVVMQSAG
jgi:hypothetical protein